LLLLFLQLPGARGFLRLFVRPLDAYASPKPSCLRHGACELKRLFSQLPVPLRHCVLETIGRKSGKARCTPVGDGWVGYQFWLVAEHGMKAGYVRNIAHNPRVRLKLREGLRARWHTGTAHVLSDDDPRERQRWLAGQLPSSAAIATVRLFGMELLAVRIDLDG
jgi:deazaflavin-dependent oxidoreductase (nitroreductase family)